MENSEKEQNLKKDLISAFSISNFIKIFSLIKSFITKPKDTWDEVKNFDLSVYEIYLKVLIPISVLTLLCDLINLTVIGVANLGTGEIVQIPVGKAVIICILKLATSLFFVYAAALITKALASLNTFEGNQTVENSFKLIAFPLLVYNLAKILVFVLFPIPLLGGLLSLSLIVYTLYLIFLGIGKVLEIEQRALFFVILMIALLATMIGLIMLAGIGYLTLS